MSQGQQLPRRRKPVQVIGAWHVAVAATLCGAIISVVLMSCKAESVPASAAITLDYSVHGWIFGFGREGGIDSGGVVQEFDSDRSLDYYVENGEITYRSPVLQVDVWNESANDSIRVDPFLVIETTNVEPMPDDLDVLTVTAPLEPPSAPPSDWFYAIFTPQRDRIFPALRYADYSPDSANEPLKPLYIEPEGRVEMSLTTGTVIPDAGHFGTGTLGHYFHFRVGISYFYNGEHKVKWIDEEFVTANPDKISELYKFSYVSESEYELVDQLTFIDARPGDDEAVAARVAEPGEQGPPADMREALNEEFRYEEQLSQLIATQDTKISEGSFRLPS